MQEKVHAKHKRKHTRATQAQSINAHTLRGPEEAEHKEQHQSVETAVGASAGRNRERPGDQEQNLQCIERKTTPNKATRYGVDQEKEQNAEHIETALTLF